MNQEPSKVLPFALDDSMIDAAVASLDIRGRVAGSNGLLLLDVAPPRPAIEPDLGFLAQALVGLHRSIQDDDALSDLEEALEDPLKAGDQQGIDEACDLYRGLLASRLKDLAALPEGQERIIALQKAGG